MQLQCLIIGLPLCAGFGYPNVYNGLALVKVAQNGVLIKNAEALEKWTK